MVDLPCGCWGGQGLACVASSSEQIVDECNRIGFVTSQAIKSGTLYQTAGKVSCVCTLLVVANICELTMLCACV